MFERAGEHEGESREGLRFGVAFVDGHLQPDLAQSLDEIPIVLRVEELLDALRDHLADAINLA